MRDRRLVMLLAMLAALILPCVPALGADADMAGSVRTLKGAATVVRQDDSLPVTMGMHIMRGDVLRTGPDSSMGVLFRDDTSLSLGPGAEITVDDFVFDPAEGRLGMLVEVGRGTAAFISGEIAKLRPESMVVTTPLSTIGIRGTRFVVKVEGE